MVFSAFLSGGLHEQDSEKKVSPESVAREQAFFYSTLCLSSRVAKVYEAEVGATLSCKRHRKNLIYYNKFVTSRRLVTKKTEKNFAFLMFIICFRYVICFCVGVNFKALFIALKTPDY